MRLRIAMTLMAAVGWLLTARGGVHEVAEGWVTCGSVVSAGDYDVTGGGDGSLIVLRSHGGDMRYLIADAVNSHDVVVLDGSGGDFELSSFIDFRGLSGKTIVGVNGACVTTTFFVTDEIRALMDSLDVKSLSQRVEDDLGGTLSNGAYVAELCELTIRQALIDLYGDERETYRYAGGFQLSGCDNIIIRNIDFAGPGSLDVGGMDLLTLNGCDHVWVDRCRFTDGLDGNLDIINNSDFVTVSDTHFRYSAKSYNHPLSNLNSGTELTDGSPQKNNISWIRCYWGEGCSGRMPYTVLGIHHILNCYWDCTGGTCIDAHRGSRVLIENSYFTNKVKRALAVRDDDVRYEWRGSVWQAHPSQMSNARVDVPYVAAAMSVADVPAAVKMVGPRLEYFFERELGASPGVVDFGTVYAGNEVTGRFTIAAYGKIVPGRVTLTAPPGFALSLEPEGVYTPIIEVVAEDANLLQADVYVKASLAVPGAMDGAVEVTGDDVSLTVPLIATVVSPGRYLYPASLSWPLDRGTASDMEGTVADGDEAFSRATMSLGDKLYLHSGHSIVGAGMFALFNPTEAVGKLVDKDCRVEIEVTAAPGYVFVPARLSMKAARVGTDMCLVDVEVSRSGNESVKLLSGFQPARSSATPAYSEIDLPLSGAGIGPGLKVSLYLYNMLANKQLALRDVVIEGAVYAEDSGIAEECLADEAVGAVYYDLRGCRVMNPRSGRVYIESRGGKSRVAVYRSVTE